MVIVKNNKKTLSPTKNVGAFVDRNFRSIRLAFLNLFRKIGVDLTADQWLVIDILYQNDSLSLNELSEKCFKNPATMSRIIDIMIFKNYVWRDPTKEDKRKLNIGLTQHGKNIYELTIEHVNELRENGWKGLNERDFLDFLRIMNIVFENYSKA